MAKATHSTPARVAPSAVIDLVDGIHAKLKPLAALARVCSLGTTDEHAAWCFEIIAGLADAARDRVDSFRRDAEGGV